MRILSIKFCLKPSLQSKQISCTGCFFSSFFISLIVARTYSSNTSNPCSFHFQKNGSASSVGQVANCKSLISCLILLIVIVLSHYKFFHLTLPQLLCL